MGIIKFILGFLIIYIIWAIIVNKKSKEVAKAIISVKKEGIDPILQVDDGVYAFDIYYEDTLSLYALALLYCVKMRYVIETEPYSIKELFIEGLDEVIKNWPNIFEPKPSIHSVSLPKYKFVIKIFKNGSYSIINSLPSKVYSYDLMAHYFFLLKKIIDILNQEEKTELKNLFINFKEEILKSSSLMHSMKTVAKINQVLDKVSERDKLGLNSNLDEVHQEKISKLELRDNETKTCPNCGYINKKESKFCTQCGFKLSENIISNNELS